jgi:hypothetical protein
VAGYALMSVWDEASRKAQAREAEAGAEQAMADTRAASAKRRPPGTKPLSAKVAYYLPAHGTEARAPRAKACIRETIP